MNLVHPQFRDLSLENQVPLHQVLQHLQSSLQSDTWSKAAVELESKGNRECCDNYHDRDIDGSEGELRKSCELIAQPRAYRRIVRVKKEDPVGEPTDQSRLDGYELDQ